MSRFGSRIDATGPGGNIFAILGTARRYMREIGIDQSEIEELGKAVCNADSYRDAVALVREWFPVDLDEAAPNRALTKLTEQVSAVLSAPPRRLP